MAELPITTRQAVRVSVVFVLLIIGFGILSSITGWPDKGGWGLAVILSLVVAALPLAGPLLAFLSESGAVVDIKGVKFDFTAIAVRGTVVERSNFQDDPGIQVNNSSAASIAEAAEAARSATVVFVDLGTGRSWYPSRLFVLAAAAEELRGAEAIVIVAQQGAILGRFIGWLTPHNVVTAFRQEDARYGIALSQARAVLQHLRLSGGSSAYAFPPDYGGGRDLLNAYLTTGDLAFVPALISQLQKPEPALPPPQMSLEQPGTPSWLSPGEAERILNPWLIRETIRLDQSDAEKRAKLALVDHPFLAVTEVDGKYRGMIKIATTLSREVFGSAGAKV